MQPVPQPTPTDPPGGAQTAPLVELGGPYDVASNGRCADGHPLNAYGRCQTLNVQTGGT